MSEATASAAPTTPQAGAAAAPEAQQPETQAAPKSPDFKGTKHKLKVNQQEVELDYDDVIALAQKGKSADERFKEAAAAKRDVDQFLKDPWGYLRQKGTDPYEVAESLLLEKIRYEQLTDDQKEALHAKMERDQLKAEKEEREKSEREREQAALQARAIQEIDQDIADALKSSGRKPTPRLIARIAENMMAHLERSGTRISAKDILGSVEKEYVTDISEYLSQMTPDQLKQVLPKELLDGLRKANIEQVMSADPARSRRRIVSGEPEPAIRPRKAMSWDEAFQEKEKRYRR